MERTIEMEHARELRGLFGLFPGGSDMPEYEFVAADEVPDPYHGLLVHNQHMTVTVERFHHGPVNVQVLAVREDPQWYARKILLRTQAADRSVQFGIMRVWWHACPQSVQDEIRAARTPLGRILIAHAVLRRIEPLAYLRVLPGPAMMDWFGKEGSHPTYGRLATIHCNGQPAVDLVEIVAPD